MATNRCRPTSCPYRTYQLTMITPVTNCTNLDELTRTIRAIRDKVGFQSLQLSLPACDCQFTIAATQGRNSQGIGYSPAQAVRVYDYAKQINASAIKVEELCQSKKNRARSA